MNSWPTVYLPPLAKDISLPPLSVITGQGERRFTGGSDIRMYVCGITPYDATHLGHAATYLTFDLINRYLQASARPVNFVENITDIDEPLLERAERDGTDWQSLAASQIALFQSDMTALRLLPPDNFVPATAVMDLVSQAISQLEQNGFVYRIEQDLYFDISSFLPQLPLPLDQALEIFGQRGGDPMREGKRHPLDPVLWLGNKEGEPGWQSPHGFGRPGWHIECCVISLRYLLGASFALAPLQDHLIDIQGGGSDLIFPHHFMSAAQAHALTGSPFAFAYIHTGMVGLDGEKMSKSKGNLVFVSTLLNQGVDPMVIRWALLNNHYSQDRMWSENLLHQASQEVAALRRSLSREIVAPTDRVIEGVVRAIAEDLDTPRALSALLDWNKKTESGETGGSAGELARAIDLLLGLAL